MEPRSYIDERNAERRRRALSGAVVAAMLAAAAFSVLVVAGSPDPAPTAPVAIASSNR